MTEANKGPHAIVLSGGGAYAAYEIGVMKALFEGASPATAMAPVDPQIFTGTSAGAYNATFLASQTDVDIQSAVRNLETVWLTQLAGDRTGCRAGVTRYRLDPFTLLDPVCFLSNPVRTLGQLSDDVAFLTADFSKRASWFVNAPGPIEERLTRLVDLSLLFAEDLRALIPATIPFQNIANSPLALRIAVTNWSSGKLEVYSNPDMATPSAPLFVLASAATPGIFPPVEIGQQVYVDGGVLMNTPLRPAIDAGAGTLHIIYLDPDIALIPVSRLRNTLDTMDRIWAIQNAESLNTDIETAARVNRGLEYLRNVTAAAPGVPGEIWSSLVHFVGHARRSSEAAGGKARNGGLPIDKYKQVTIHRYHPDDDLGGFFGLLRFDRPIIESLIQRGYDDALRHDCTVEGCITPAGTSF